MSEESRKPVCVERMSVLFRIQHMLLIISLLVLAVTGFALMYHENRLAQALISLEGGVLYRGIIHRVAAVFLMAQLVYHAFYMLFSREGKRELDEVWLSRRDFDDFLQAMRYNLRMGNEYPRFGKYGYKEKFQYWGATTGIFLISVTGVILWAQTLSIRLLSKFVLVLPLPIHGYQGILIYVVLLFWHLYIVHLHPSVFPMNMAGLHGKVDAEWLRGEHPREYEKLKGERSE